MDLFITNNADDIQSLLYFWGQALGNQATDVLVYILSRFPEFNTKFLYAKTK